MRPQRVGSTVESEPRPKVICGKPLSMAIGMGGRTGRGRGVCIEKDFTNWTMKRARLSGEDDGAAGWDGGGAGNGNGGVKGGGLAAGLGKD